MQSAMMENANRLAKCTAISEMHEDGAENIRCRRAFYQTPLSLYFLLLEKEVF